jgi:osmotically-inducible protein OsmY
MRFQSMKTVFATLAVAFTVTSACSLQDDPADRVSEALKQAQLDDVSANYDSDSKVVHLKGNVASPADRERAEDIAERAVGTSGKVLNEVTVEDVDERSADNNDGQIRRQLYDMVDRNAQLADRDINFDVNNGAVEIKGTVASAAEKTQVSEIAKSVAGVKDVANGLTIDAKAKAQEPNPASNRRPAPGTRDNPPAPPTGRDR